MDVMARMGAALRRFHDRTAQPATFDGRALAGKLLRYVERLEPIVGDREVLTQVRDAATGIGKLSQPAGLASTLKGIDIRNLLLAHDDGVVLLDPGRRKVTLPEADLARFLMTYRILWWGHPAFLIGFRPDAAAEAAFLRAYGHEEPAREALFRAQMIKELLKHWFTAHDSLKLKAFAPSVKRMLAKGWIDPYYSSQLRAEIALLA